MTLAFAATRFALHLVASLSMMFVTTFAVMMIMAILAVTLSWLAIVTTVSRFASMSVRILSRLAVTLARFIIALSWFAFMTAFGWLASVFVTILSWSVVALARFVITLAVFGTMFFTALGGSHVTADARQLLLFAFGFLFIVFLFAGADWGQILTDFFKIAAFARGGGGRGFWRGWYSFWSG